jgi:hypothetical protein
MIDWEHVPASVQYLFLHHECCEYPREEDVGEWISGVLRKLTNLSSIFIFKYVHLNLAACILEGSNLRTICVRNGIVTDDALHRIAQHCPHLEHLSLLESGSPNISHDMELFTDGGIRAVLQRCIGLRSFEVRSAGLSQLTDAAFTGAACAGLASLALDSERLTDGFLRLVAACAPRLEELYVGDDHCDGAITPEGVIDAARRLPALRVLCVRGSAPFLIKHIRALADALPRAESVEFFASPRIEDPAAAFARRCPSPSLARIRARTDDLNRNRAALVKDTMRPHFLPTSPESVVRDGDDTPSWRRRGAPGDPPEGEEEEEEEEEEEDGEEAR